MERYIHVYLEAPGMELHGYVMMFFLADEQFIWNMNLSGCMDVHLLSSRAVVLKVESVGVDTQGSSWTFQGVTSKSSNLIH